MIRWFPESALRRSSDYAVFCMDLNEVFTRFPDQAACIAHLEAIRWGDHPACPRCGSPSVARKADGTRVGRWNCRGCRSSFNVLQGTIFQKTRIPLQKWFLAIGILASAGTGVSSGRLARDLDLNQKSAWFLALRVRAALSSDATGLLSGIAAAGGRNGHRGGMRPRDDRGRGLFTRDGLMALHRAADGDAESISARVLASLNAGAALLPVLLPRAQPRPAETPRPRPRGSRRDPAA